MHLGKKDTSIYYQVITLWSHISNKRKKHFYLLLALMIISVFAEIISLGSVIPFISVLINPSYIKEIEIFQKFIVFWGLKDDSLLTLITIIFCFAALLAGLIRLLFLYLSYTIVYLTGAELSSEIYKKCLYQSYDTHISWNSSEIVNAIIVNVNRVIGGILLPTVNLMSSFLILIGITLFLIIISPIITVLSLTFFCFLYLLIILVTKRKVEANSFIISKESSLMIKSIQEGLGNIRDVIIHKNHDFYTETYRKADYPMRKASGLNAFIASSPRLIIEIFGLIFIAIVALLVSLSNDGIMLTLPFLAALALGAVRMLPMAQQSYAAVISLKGFEQVLISINGFLDQKINNSQDLSKIKKLSFTKMISLKDLSFKYESNEKYLFNNVNININKGDTIGIVGVTGSGKSTLTDLISGLIRPLDGKIIIDNTELNENNIADWQKNIAYVPQNIFLTDNSIAENIALGVQKDFINKELLEYSAKIADINDFVMSLKDNYKTIVGERGSKLSGGQRQRIGIARAIYRKPEVIIFDEATNALDMKTEYKIIESISNLQTNITKIIIAHQGLSLNFCNKILELKDGALIMNNNEDKVT